MMPTRTATRLPARPWGGAQRGFTMIELLVTMVIAALLAMVAVPSFNDAILSNKLGSFTNLFTASAQLARSEAIKRNASITMCRSSDGAACATTGGWEQGWIVFNDRNGNASIDSDETRIHYQQAMSSDFRFTGDNYSIVFQASGLSASTAALKVCRLTPSPGAQERSVTMTASGRVAAAKTTTGTCP